MTYPIWLVNTPVFEPPAIWVECICSRAGRYIGAGRYAGVDITKLPVELANALVHEQCMTSGAGGCTGVDITKLPVELANVIAVYFLHVFSPFLSNFETFFLLFHTLTTHEQQDKTQDIIVLVQKTTSIDYIVHKTDFFKTV